MALVSAIAALGTAARSPATAATRERPRTHAQSTDPRVSPFFTVAVDKTTGLRDGDTVHFTVTPRPGVNVVPTSAQSNITQECSASTASEGDLADHTKCSDAQQSALMPNIYGKFFWYPDGSKAVGSMVVGVGDAVDPNNKANVVTCDATHSCRLVLSGQILDQKGDPLSLFDASTVLRFAATNNTASGCNGLASGVISSAAPDRLADVWAKWQGGECAAHKTAGGAESTTISFPTGGEAKALDFFSTGAADLAYTAVGPDTAGFTPSKTRPWVAIPIGLDASVMALAGGHATTTANPVPGIPIGLPQPFGNVDLTIPQIAELVSRGPSYSQTVPDIVARNPTLIALFGNLDVSQKPWAPAGPNSVSLFSSSSFEARAAAQWRTPAIEGDKPRGVITDFALASPQFTQTETNLYSSRAVLAKPVWTAFNSWAAGVTVQEMWMLTDLATANSEGAATTRVQTSKGDFVAPTAASIQAAVPTMQTAKDGMLRPDPAPNADRSGVYPLSFVEYAIAPAQPLVDGTCTLRTNSQTLLQNWLTYITTTGQSNMADGLVPLTPALQQQAAAAIAKVGKSPTTGTCQGKVHLPNGRAVGGGAGGGGAGGGGGFGSGGGAGGFGANGLDNAALAGSGLGSNPASAGAGSLGAAASRVPTAASRREAQKAAQRASIKMPSFLGATPVSALIPPMSLLLITLITYIAGLGTSGRPVWPRFGRRRRVVGAPRFARLRRLRPAQ